ncbi:type I DNA topoisomerase [Alkalimonas sp.]|uniref:DNA topoisomerase family protein n=1 Tax=Alkalimonas sp. TaxID=1872453 RepID=UPI00263B7D60|nr:topoisomerase DNA-binding C4 zinc finger domain-containing protein [Alkalimonas sp.]MCC5825987.1 topoisomerase DNA-binding C4 zinc finger domain-containing protein [Alkalimonas sp.]
MSSPSDPLFKLPQHQGDCPLCQHPLQIKSGKSGPFLGCSNYPTCHYLKPLHEHEHSLVKVLPHEPCPSCGQPLAVKNGRYGMFIGCSNYPACDFVVHEEATQTEQFDCPACKKGQLVERISKYGKHFYGCNCYPKCKFLLNEQPVAGSCQRCNYPLLVRKQTAKGDKLLCADKSCQAEQQGLPG